MDLADVFGILSPRGTFSFGLRLLYVISGLLANNTCVPTYAAAIPVLVTLAGNGLQASDLAIDCWNGASFNV